ncbi:MAG: thioredoxin domain-containing protein [Gemmatimonadaceae bacterium]|nr:thioredoxin domain-containing protein [Gemmatimonadaceae bacterium]NUQ91269.1 thioredoxin domain-containing protein [Gemmatimonadaceae bacterium]NUR18280.1 thioredoxin domain-containing protein [Gemmatimonadaceae bacterium]NUS95900.1 thioredoxin domain-containing protein [Gemmatimonadaceae bacterium]
MSRLTPPVGADDHALGPADAPVTLVEYGDYECPHCGRAAPIVERVVRRFGDRLRFVFRNFPLTEMHPHAEHAAEAAESAGAHGGERGFWAMHHAIYAHQQDGPDALGDARLAEYAGELGLDGRAVLADVRAERSAERIQSDFMSGVRSGVNGTPTFFINGRRFDEAWDDEGLSAAIERAGARGQA